MRSMMRTTILATLAASVVAVAADSRWPEARARAWYARQPWLVGANYIPASAINELEMWQAETFDPARIDRELAQAAAIGMNTMRVFLHDLVWQQDAAGYRRRIGEFLSIAQKHGIRPMFVLFDSCWDPYPRLGRQREPKPGVHNSGWVQSPGAEALRDRAQEPRLESYVRGVVGAFAGDVRVLAWDLWNEPDNRNEPAYVAAEPADKLGHVERLLAKAFTWARAAQPSQPLTSGVWQGDWSSDDKLSPIARIQLANSDAISFHEYGEPAKLEARIRSLERWRRPILCTEYMARGNGSTFAGSLPVGLKYGVAMYNWGLVAGRTQTHLPWDSWKQPYVGGREPAVWFHEVFRNNGEPYRADEVKLIRRLTGEARERRKAG
jgi:hypothetical protein